MINSKKILASLISAAVCFLHCLAFSTSTAQAAEFLSDTYFWGFENNTRPSVFSTTYIDGAFSNGIWQITPQERWVDKVISENPRVTESVLAASPRIIINQSFQAEAVNCLKIRVKHDLAFSGENDYATITVFYSVLENGVPTAFIEDNKFTMRVYQSSTNGEYVTYTLPFTGKASYAGTISSIRVDLLNKYGTESNPTIDVDYIMLTKEDSAITTWSFDSASDLSDWVPRSNNSTDNSWSVSDGMLNLNLGAVAGSGRFSIITLTYTPSTPIETTDYDYIEVIMKHDNSHGTYTGEDNRTMKLYMQGDIYHNNGIVTPFVFGESSKKNYHIEDTSNGNFYRYVLPLSGALVGVSGKNIDDAKLTKLRLDPIRDTGTCSIESIRLIPKNYADMTDVGGHEEGTDSDHVNMGFTVETDHLSEYNSIKMKVNTGSKRLVGGYDFGNTFGNISGSAKLGLQINDVPTDYENYITVQLSPDTVTATAAGVTDLD